MRRKGKLIPPNYLVVRPPAARNSKTPKMNYTPQNRRSGIGAVLRLHATRFSSSRSQTGTTQGGVEMKLAAIAGVGEQGQSVKSEW
jgi:hypothetical protein